METPNASSPPSGSRQATAREFLAVVFRRRWLIIGLFVVTTATVLTIAFSNPIEYVSSGRVLVRRGEQESLLNPFRRVVDNWENDLGSEVEVAKSQPVLDRARKILREETPEGSAAPPVHGDRVDVEVMGKSNVVAIAYSDRDPAIARRVCDAVVRAYVGYRQDLTLTYPGNFFDRNIADVSRELDQKLEARRKFANRVGVVDVDEQKRVTLSLLGNLINMRTEVDADLAETRAEVQAMRTLYASKSMDFPTVGVISPNENALIGLKSRVLDQEAKVAQLSERYRDDAPEMVNARGTLGKLQDMLEREVEGRLSGAQARVTALESKLAAVDEQIGEVRSELAALPNKETTIAELDQDISLLKKRYQDYVESSDRARITEKTTQTVTVLLLNSASPPVPSNSRDYVRLALAPAFSLVAGVALAFFFDGLDITVRTAGHAEEVADVPVLASLTERRRSG